MFVERRPPLYALPKRMIATSSRLRLVREPVGTVPLLPRLGACACDSRFERVCSATFTSLPIRHPLNSLTHGYLLVAQRSISF